MRIFVISLLILFMFITSSSAANTYLTIADRVACISKSDFNKTMDYAAVKDRVAFDKMIDGRRCIIMKDGVEVQIMDTDWSLVEIRPIGKEGTLWTSKNTYATNKRSMR